MEEKAVKYSKTLFIYMGRVITYYQVQVQTTNKQAEDSQKW